ncbi:MAG: hypothetical protein FJ319_10850 [SAR202 cluster bacterium]|nr:hypothetical protein [SAR202 cluster bacterium]
MTSEGIQIPKPDAEAFKQGRKLYLVPIFSLPKEMPVEGQKVVHKYWSEVRDQIRNLERMLGKVAHVYHEAVFTEGDDALSTVADINAKGVLLVRELCRAEAKLHATEDRDLMEEFYDWHMVLTIGVRSRRVMTMAMDAYREAVQKRYDSIGARIDQTLQGDESGVLMIRDDHHVQFAPDIQVFYISPPGLDAIKRWLDEQYRSAMSQAAPGDGEPVESGPPAQS